MRHLPPSLLPLVLTSFLLSLVGCYNVPSRRGADDDDSASGGGDDDTSAVDDDDLTDDDDDDDDAAPDCEPEGSNTCFGQNFMVCEQESWAIEEECSAPSPLCDSALGCVECSPTSGDYCVGDQVWTCDGSGTGSLVSECEDGSICASGACFDSCDLAEQQMSYFGCRFLAVSTSNAILPADFAGDFAVVVANPASNAEDAVVTVSRGGSVVATATVAAGAAQAISLPMVSELQLAQESVIITDGAYEVTSSVPVAAYQYNPLNFQIGAANSFTNDASLLLPEHVLSGNYMANTWPTWGKGSWTEMPFFGLDGQWDNWYPGFVTVAATVDGTQVTITSSTTTAAGNPAPMSPGGTTTVTLNRGDVMQLYSQRPTNSSDVNFCSNNGWDQVSVGCPASFGQDCDAYCSVTGGDLTGTRITATEDVAVFAGHMCTFMPFASWACDHLEEMMFPLETWGVFSVMTAPMHPGGSGVVRTRYRVLASQANTEVSFDPAVNGTVTLAEGAFVEFETDQDFVVSATQAIHVTQTMLGEDELGSSAGDPAMGSGIPWVQVRNSYDFLVPDTYLSNYINVVSPAGTPISLDGAPITGFTAIATTGYEVARVLASPGEHHIESDNGVGFGLTAYGYASYTSYFYPGGMNFTR